MQTKQQLIDEQVELDKKAAALAKTIAEDSAFAELDTDDQDTLRAQHEVMVRYSSILTNRIEKLQ